MVPPSTCSRALRHCHGWLSESESQSEDPGLLWFMHSNSSLSSDLQWFPLLQPHSAPSLLCRTVSSRFLNHLRSRLVSCGAGLGVDRNQSLTPLLASLIPAYPNVGGDVGSMGTEVVEWRMSCVMEVAAAGRETRIFWVHSGDFN